MELSPQGISTETPEWWAKTGTKILPTKKVSMQDPAAEMVKEICPFPSRGALVLQ